MARRSVISFVMIGAALALCLIGRPAAALDFWAPKTPKPRSPLNGAKLTNYPRSVTLSWGAVSDSSGVEYYLEIETFYPSGRGSSGEWRVERIGPLRETSHSHLHVGDQPGRWRVWAVDGANNDGKKSDWQTFSFDTSASAPPPETAREPLREDSVIVSPPAFVQVTPAPMASPTPYPTPAPPVESEWERPSADRGITPRLSDPGRLIAELRPGAPPAAPRPFRGGIEDLTPPDRVEASSPASGAYLSGYPRVARLAWQPASDPSGVSYVVEVQTRFPFSGGSGAYRSQFYRVDGMTQIEHEHPGDYEGRWRVWAVDGAGNEGPSSDWRTFQFNTASNSARTAELRVDAPVAAPPRSIERPRPEAQTSRAEPTARSNIQAAIAAVEASLLAAESNPLETPAADVEAASAPRIPAPRPLTPPDGAILSDDEPYVRCEWTPVPGAKYTLEIQSFDALTGNWSPKTWEGLENTSRTPPLEAPLRHRWRVRAVVGGEAGEWSPWRHVSFHGEGQIYAGLLDGTNLSSDNLVSAVHDESAPLPPQLVEPGDDALASSPLQSAVLRWTPVEELSGASYACVIEIERPDPSGSGMMQWDRHIFINLVRPELTYQNPLAGRIRWRVAAINRAGLTSRPSAARTLTFQGWGMLESTPGAGAAPEALFPLDGMAAPSGPTRLVWRPVSQANARYRVEAQILESSAGGGGIWKKVVDEVAPQNTLAWSIPKGAIARWRVAVEGGGADAASSWQQFQAGY